MDLRAGSQLLNRGYPVSASVTATSRLARRAIESQLRDATDIAPSLCKSRRNNKETEARLKRI
jgi:hypothetical protein